MQKKSIFAVLGVMLAVMVASLTLVFTVGPMVSADSEPPLIPSYYLDIKNGELKGFTSSGQSYVNSISAYRMDIPAGVTSIGYMAFCEKTGNLVSLRIANNVTSIGYGAFYNCPSLKSLELGNSVTSINQFAFYNCTNLTNFTIPSSVTSIGACAFSGCTGLTSIIIPSSVTSIGVNAFDGCRNLTSMNYLGTIDQWCHIIFASKGSNPASITRRLYINGNLVTDVVIPDDVTSINNAFTNCANIKSITIPDSVTSIGSSAFEGCTGLTCITIPNSVTSIGQDAFMYCTGLTSIILPDSVDNISESRVFSYCTNLTSISLPEGYKYCYWDSFTGCKNLTSIRLPSSITFLDSRAFSDCTNLTEIIVENPDFMNNTGLASYKAQGIVHCAQNTVTFDTGCEVEVASQPVDYNNTADKPVPTRTGYGFDCWYLDDAAVPFDFNTPITDDITLHAAWIANKYTVVYEYMDGSPAGNDTVNYNGTLNRPLEPEREGYTFVNWYTEPEHENIYNFNTPITGDITLYADWHIMTYTITFITNGGTTIPQQFIDYGNTITVTTEKPGYNFEYWYLTDENVPFDLATPVSSDLILHAKWTEIPAEPETTDETAIVDDSQNHSFVAWLIGGLVAVFGAIGTVVGVLITKKFKK